MHVRHAAMQWLSICMSYKHAHCSAYDVLATATLGTAMSAASQHSVAKQAYRERAWLLSSRRLERLCQQHAQRLCQQHAQLLCQQHVSSMLLTCMCEPALSTCTLMCSCRALLQQCGQAPSRTACFHGVKMACRNSNSAVLHCCVLCCAASVDVVACTQSDAGTGKPAQLLHARNLQ
jgi:hypothetical protein